MYAVNDGEETMVIMEEHVWTEYCTVDFFKESFMHFVVAIMKIADGTLNLEIE